MERDIRRAHQHVQLVRNGFGGRLKFYGEEATPDFWDRAWSSSPHASDYRRETEGHLPYSLRKAFLTRIGPGATVLEAGSGLGHFTVAMHARGFNAIGVDYAPDVVNMLKSRFPDIEFRLGDVLNLIDFLDESVDAIYSPGVCEHFEEGPHQVLQESFRVLRPGGILVASTPCFNLFRRGAAKLGAYNDSPSHELPFYQYAFSVRDFSALLASAGFEVEATIGKGSWQTLESTIPLLARLPRRVQTFLGGSLDRSPLATAVGHSCLWVARKSNR